MKKRQYTWVHSTENILTMARLDGFYFFKHKFCIFKDLGFCL